MFIKTKNSLAGACYTTSTKPASGEAALCLVVEKSGYIHALIISDRAFAVKGWYTGTYWRIILFA
ncbi:MAG: hypothetical protein TR69_WS6001000324 [candidate division WS6 bacterium OLB20]|uniref:Uncharacterized protein n=1 Tax=candidate division WS6 bacterium OLB20 TaxID=1617426 RepID=A0A136M0P4_9BACT|nr:MAG: hypothetical protein TR69_WS6001000324 [candidate division WS6 bacterium OLB20]